MTPSTPNEPKDGQRCRVVAGTHTGKSGIVRDVNISKMGHMTITVVQDNGESSRPWAGTSPSRVKAMPSHAVERRSTWANEGS